MEPYENDNPGQWGWVFFIAGLITFVIIFIRDQPVS